VRAQHPVPSLRGSARRSRSPRTPSGARRLREARETTPGRAIRAIKLHLRRTRLPAKPPIRGKRGRVSARFSKETIAVHPQMGFVPDRARGLGGASPEPTGTTVRSHFHCTAATRSREEPASSGSRPGTTPGSDPSAITRASTLETSTSSHSRPGTREEALLPATGSRLHRAVTSVDATTRS
jgi:hypothetical protein